MLVVPFALTPQSRTSARRLHKLVQDSAIFWQHTHFRLSSGETFSLWPLLLKCTAATPNLHNGLKKIKEKRVWQGRCVWHLYHSKIFMTNYFMLKLEAKSEFVLSFFFLSFFFRGGLGIVPTQSRFHGDCSQQDIPKLYPPHHRWHLKVTYLKQPPKIDYYWTLNHSWNIKIDWSKISFQGKYEDNESYVEPYWLPGVQMGIITHQ